MSAYTFSSAGAFRLLVAVALAIFLNAFPSEAGTTAFKNVNVITMDSNSVLGNQTVIVTTGKIAEMGGAYETPVPPDADIIDGEGMYLMPGLADMHTHLKYDLDPAHLWLYLGAGVTTIRNMSGMPSDLLLRERVARGEIPGPNIYTAGPVISGIPPQKSSKIKMVRGGIIFAPLAFLLLLWTILKNSLESISLLRKIEKILKTAAFIWTAAVLFGFLPVGMVIKLRHPDLFIVDQYWQAAAELNDQAKRPYDFVKVHDHLSPVSYDGLMNAAREKGRYVAGHLPDMVPLKDVLSSGQNEVAHVGEYLSYLRKNYDPMVTNTEITAWEMDDSGIGEAVKLTADNKVAVVVDLVADDRAYGILNDSESLFSAPEYALVRPEILDAWKENGIPLKALDDGGKYLRDQVRPIVKKLVVALNNAGVTLVAGTNSMAVGVVPGVHMHRELELLVETGLTPFEALLTATRNAASVTEKMTGDGKWGVVAEGMRADLLLLDKNPLADIGNIRTVKGVMVKGRWYSNEDLEEGLSAYKKSFGKGN